MIAISSIEETNVALVNGGEKLSGVSLTPNDLNDLDEAILEYLAKDGRASPTLFMRANDVDTSRQWVSSRFIRLAEHDHIRELYDTGIYEISNDPRGENKNG